MTSDSYAVRYAIPNVLKRHFYECSAFNQNAIIAADLNLYASHYLLRVLCEQDLRCTAPLIVIGEDNKAALERNGRLTMPVLALGGTSSLYLAIARAMLAEVANKVTAVGIPDAGHWIAEENPEALVKELHLLKTVLFLKMVEDGMMPLRPGVKRLVSAFPLSLLACSWQICFPL